jgi:hypothetical protein
MQSHKRGEGLQEEGVECLLKCIKRVLKNAVITHATLVPEPTAYSKLNDRAFVLLFSRPSLRCSQLNVV